MKLEIQKNREISKIRLCFFFQCRNIRIFLAFRFYVKSILENVEVLNSFYNDTKVISSFLIIKGSPASCPAVSASAAVSSNAEIFANPPKYRKIESDAKEYRSFVGQALFAKNEKGESIVEKFARTFKIINHFQFYYVGSYTFEGNIDYCTIISKSSRENGFANFDLCTFHFIF